MGFGERLNSQLTKTNSFWWGGERREAKGGSRSRSRGSRLCMHVQGGAAAVSVSVVVVVEVERRWGARRAPTTDDRRPTTDDRLKEGRESGRAAAVAPSTDCHGRCSGNEGQRPVGVIESNQSGGYSTIHRPRFLSSAQHAPQNEFSNNAHCSDTIHTNRQECTRCAPSSRPPRVGLRILLFESWLPGAQFARRTRRTRRTRRRRRRIHTHGNVVASALCARLRPLPPPSSWLLNRDPPSQPSPSLVRRG